MKQRSSAHGSAPLVCSSTGTTTGVAVAGRANSRTPVPSVAQVTQSLRDISEQLEAVEAENPRLQLRLASLQREENQLEDRLRENQQLISARVRENEI